MRPGVGLSSVFFVKVSIYSVKNYDLYLTQEDYNHSKYLFYTYFSIKKTIEYSYKMYKGYLCIQRRIL